MRWSYLVPRGVILSLVWLFFAFAFDPLVQRATVFTSQQVTGAKVEIGSLSTSFFPPVVELNEVRVANRFEPGENLIEFADLRIHVSGQPLLKRSYIIDEAHLTGLRWGTERGDDGLLEKADDSTKRLSPAVHAFRDKLAETGSRWIDNLIDRAKVRLDPRQLETVQIADERNRQWQERFESLEKRIRALEPRIEGIEKRVKNAKGNALEKVEIYRRAAVEVNNVLAESERLHHELSRLPKIANQDFRDIDAARLRDLESIQETADLLRFDSQAITESLLGPELAERLDRATEWLQLARETAARFSTGAAPQRMRGVDIDFSRPERLPRFLVRNLHLGGEAEIGGEIMPFEGLVTGLTSEPARHGKPVHLQISGKKTGQFQLVAQLDHTIDEPIHRIELAYQLPEQTTMRLGKKGRMTFDVSAATTEIQAMLIQSGETISGDIVIRQDPVSILVQSEKAQQDDEVSRLVQNAAEGIRRLEASAKVSGTIAAPQWALESNLGEQLAFGLNQSLAREIAAGRRELEAKIETAARKEITKFGQELNGRYSQLFAQLNANETGAKRLIEKVAVGRALDLNGILKLK